MAGKLSLTPARGIDNVNEDAALYAAPGEDGPGGLYLREALNVDITAQGKVLMRGAVRKVSGQRLRHLWRSPLHGDVFGVAGTGPAAQWGRIDPRTWQHQPLLPWRGEWASHCVLGYEVAVAGADGIWLFNGQSLRRLTIDTPPPPMVAPAGVGRLHGHVAVAVSWLRGRVESSVSRRAECEAAGAVAVTLPLPLDASIERVRVYMSTPGGRDWLLAGEYPASTAQVTLTGREGALSGAPFEHLDAMPPGRWMHWWQGRLLTAGLKQVHFSEAMAWHLHDRRHGTVPLPQRITFMAPVAGGVWVGQRDHVLFLSGTNPDEWQVQRMAGQPPVPGSVVLLSAEDAGAAAGGQAAAVWLAANGYVMGTAGGQMLELGGQRLQGIAAASGASTLWGSRILTLLA